MRTCTPTSVHIHTQTHILRGNIKVINNEAAMLTKTCLSFLNTVSMNILRSISGNQACKNEESDSFNFLAV